MSIYYPFTNSNLVEYQKFSYDYFSGCNVSLFFGDIFVDELVAIQFEVQERILPIYGYNSYTYDAIAHGARIINGEFKINFKESGYLFHILNKLQSKTASESEFNSVTKIEYLTSKGFLDKNIADNFANLDAFIAQYENAIWSSPADTAKQQYNKPYFNAVKSPNDCIFNILIVYSPGQGYNQLQYPVANSTKNNNLPNYTIESINDVHIYGCSKLIDSTGQPIQEIYRFTARDWNNAIQIDNTPT